MLNVSVDLTTTMNDVLDRLSLWTRKHTQNLYGVRTFASNYRLLIISVSMYNVEAAL